MARDYTMIKFPAKVLSVGQDYSLVESPHFFGSVEGQLFSPLFNRNVNFLAKNSEYIYAVRCAKYFESIKPDNIAEFPALYKCLKALCLYVADLLDEHSEEYDTGDLVFDESSDVSDLLREVSVAGLTFERSAMMAEEECPIAISLKLSLNCVPDECMEAAFREDEAIFAGEFRGASPWNDKLLKKKFNYLREL